MVSFCQTSVSDLKMAGPVLLKWDIRPFIWQKRASMPKCALEQVIYEFVYLIAVISLSLGVTNLLPIPALDGGKFALLIIEAIRHKKMNEETELKIQSIGFTFLILLSLYISLNDIKKLF